MAAIFETRFIFRALAVAFTCIVFSGCQSFDVNSNAVVGTSSPTPEAEVIGQYQLQLIPSFGSPVIEKVDIAGPVTVQDALEASGAIRKFRSMKISLGRIVKDKGHLLKLPIDYQVRSKTVRDDQNYQLLPGDTLTVSSKKSNSIDKAIEAISGGLL